MQENTVCKLYAVYCRETMSNFKLIIAPVEMENKFSFLIFIQ